MRFLRTSLWALLISASCLFPSTLLAYQNRTPSHLLFGDVRLSEDEASSHVPYAFVIILRASNGRIVGRDTVPPNGRFRFQNVANGEYVLTIELENREIVRDRFLLFELKESDIRRDYELERKVEEPGVPVAAALIYARPPAHQQHFASALAEMEQANWAAAAQALEEIVRRDPDDYEAWTELGTVYFSDRHYGEAEQAYRSALKVRPDFTLATANLGKLCLVQDRFEEALENLLLVRAAGAANAETEYLLGEAYLGMRLGSKAVPHFREALKLEPLAMAKAHLRLGRLFDAAGYRELAIAEYARFLEKNPEFPEAEALRAHIQMLSSR